MQDSGEDATSEDKDVPGGDTPESGAAVEPEAPAREDRSARQPRWWTADHLRGLTWRDLAARRPRSRFEPGPLGLLGVMLSAMAVTLLLLQTGSGGLSGEEGEGADGPVSVPGPPDGELRIMLVGSSITQGTSGDHTWRYHLWSHLSDQEVDFDLVGPHDDLYSLEDEESGDHSYAEPDFDTDHAARWGATAQDLSDDIAQVAAEYEPHYVLLLAGTEDILAGGGADHALDGIAEIVSTVRVVIDDARFVVGELPAVEGTEDDDRANDEIGQFNMGLVDLAGQLASETSPMVVAQVAEDYDPTRDNRDATNPNVQGEHRIAAAFADALATPLGVGEEYPRPLPDLAAEQLDAPEPDYKETGDGLLITWDDVPGATDYQVVQRRVEPEPDDAMVVPADVESDGDERSLTVGSLLSGARYEFVVVPFQGGDEGTESEPLQVVWDDDPPSGPSWVRVLDDEAAVQWEDVEEAGHYEVWARRLECRETDDLRRPREPQDGASAADHDDAPADGDETPRPTPSEPPPSLDPPDGPDDPASPDPPSGPDCVPVDGDGPGEGDGWHTLGSAGESTSWDVTVSGPHEIVIRSYRDYVQGGYSGSVYLAGR